jgi:hypothetical protein
VGGIRNTNYAFALTRDETILYYDVSTNPPTALEFREDSSNNIGTDGREAAPIYYPGSTFIAVGTKWAIWLYDWSIYPSAPHGRSALIMFRFLHLETAGLVYLEGTNLIAHAALTVSAGRNYGSAPNYSDSKYFKKVSLYKFDDLTV